MHQFLYLPLYLACNLHRNLLAAIRSRERTRAKRIALHTWSNENTILLSWERQSELSRIRRFKSVSPVACAAGTIIIAGRRADAGGCDGALVEEGVGVAGCAGSVGAGAGAGVSDLAG